MKETIIELGGGLYPEPGTINIDCIDVPQTHIKLDFTKEKLPFVDNSIDMTIMNHSIEHIPVPRISFVLNELYRVTKVGGAIRVRTPNLNYIIDQYLAHKTQYEQPKDIETFMKAFGPITPAIWTNLRLFSGQDYESNNHFICFSEDMLKNMFEMYGFTCNGWFKGRDYQTGELRMEFLK
jgi:predicted SAM-dependent methyltransferase